MQGAGSYVVSIAVALIAGVFAWMSQRSAAKASKVNTQTVTAVDREKEAYERARAFDTETIRRQDEEIAELRKEVAEAKDEAREAKAEAAAAIKESQEVRAENIKLRMALDDFVRRSPNLD